MSLRPYQDALVAQVVEAFAQGAGSVCMQAGTGSGKTHTAAHIIQRAVRRGHRVLFLAHLDSLIEDTHERLECSRIPTGFVQSGRVERPDAPVQVASMATLHVRGVRPPADLIIIDECHRVMGPSVRGIIGAYPDAALLGLTATPQRGDGQPLGDVFEQLVCGPSNRELTALGHLVECDVLCPAKGPLEQLAERPVDAYTRETPGQRAIVFAADKAHATEVLEEFRAAGYSAELVVGETPRAERRLLRERLRSGDLQVLVGVAVFIEGWDVPEIECVILARGFGVTGPFLQAIGRGLRPAAGKARLTVIDLRGSVYMHGLPDEDRTWSITGTAVRRAEKLPAVMRCKTCSALFRPQARCPRCGCACNAGSVDRIKRVLKRAEKLEKLSALSPEDRDRKYFDALLRIAYGRMHLPHLRAQKWALTQFTKRFTRPPCHLAPNVVTASEPSQ